METPSLTGNAGPIRTVDTCQALRRELVIETVIMNLGLLDIPFDPCDMVASASPGIAGVQG